MQTLASHTPNAARANALRCLRTAMPALMRLRSDVCIGVDMVRVNNLHIDSPVRPNTNKPHYHFHSYPRSICAGYLPISLINSVHLSLPKLQAQINAGKQTGPGANAVKASHPRLGEEVIFTFNTQRVIAADQLSASCAIASQRACTDMPSRMRLRARMCIELICGVNPRLGELTGSIASSFSYYFDSILRSIGMRCKAFLLSIDHIAKRMNQPVCCPT